MDRNIKISVPTFFKLNVDCLPTNFETNDIFNFHFLKRRYI